MLVAWKEREAGYRNRRKRIIDELGYVPAYADIGPAPEEGAPQPERPARKPARRAEPVAQQAAPVEQVEEEPVLEGEPVSDGAGNGHLEADEEPAPVGGRRTTPDPEREALRAERAERKKQQRAARQKSRRKHGRSR